MVLFVPVNLFPGHDGVALCNLRCLSEASGEILRKKLMGFLSTALANTVPVCVPTTPLSLSFHA